ncbi:MAG: DUF3618 domain-containing protein [bacterium]|nr:DUF3618 domain-containing protein [bacterium]
MVEGTDQELNVGSVEPDEEITKIKEEINDVRSNMGETIDELQERLSVPAITANIKEEVSEQLSSAVDSTKEVVYETAVKGLSTIMRNFSELTKMTGGVLPLVLIGAGTGLIVMNRRGGGSGYSRGVTNGGGVKFARGRQGVGNSGSSGQGIANAASGVASSVYESVEGAVSSTASAVADVAATGKQKYSNYLEQNPMAVGAVAAAMGLAVGLALPLTETETELLGETAGSIKDQLQEAARETVGSIKETANELFDSVGQGRSETAASAERR